MTPVDGSQPDPTANDRIFRLLDQANGEISRYESLNETLTKTVALKAASAGIADEMRDNLARVTARDACRSRSTPSARRPRTPVT